MPNIPKFTDANVRELAAGEWRETEVDSGLVLRVQKRSRSYYITYTKSYHIILQLTKCCGQIDSDR